MSQTQPNILILYPDQMRADVMACAGNPVIKTPFLDQLANEGVQATHLRRDKKRNRLTVPP